MLGTPTKVIVSVSRKMWNDTSGSREHAYGIEVEIPPDAVLEDVFQHWEEQLEARLDSKFSHDTQLQVPAPVAHEDTWGEPVLPAPELEEVVEPMEVVQFKLEKREEGDFMLGLYQMYGRKVGDYPDIKFISDADGMKAMCQDNIFSDFEIRPSDLPVKKDCKYLADWNWGREYTKRDGSTGRYKDLVRIR
jgi:hypothetical protein